MGVPAGDLAALADRYRIERELGGGMSHVYLAHDLTVDRRVVLKLLSSELAGEVSAERFMREIRVAASLQQANIVPLLTTDVAGGVPYYTMPFVDGESLRHRLQSGTAVPRNEAISILRDVARALSYAHARGIVHRDIKPENVLLSHGTAMVADFGIAKAISVSRTNATDGGLTQLGMSIGTPAYMSPEQAAGDARTDHRADIYAWGVMAFELLAGAHPFADRATPAAMAAAHIATPAPELRATGVPAALRALVARALVKEPGDRPASMDEVLATLERVGTGDSESPSAPATRRRSPLLPVAALGLVGLLAAVAWLWRRPPADSAAAPATSAVVAEGPSLAVIPFTSVGGDTANSYLAEGIADELTTALAHIPELRLAGRNSAARYRGTAASPQQVGEALGVRTILIGSVRRAGSRVRVTAELSNASDGQVLWQDTFEREMTDVFAVQDALAGAIASALRLRLTGTSAIARAGTASLEAYDKYLRGVQLLYRRGLGVPDAIRFFDEAIALDSSFARAYAAKSRALVVMSYFFDEPLHRTLPAARSAAERALALSPELAEAHVAMATVHAEAFQWADAEREGLESIRRDPTLAEAQYRLGFIYYTMGRVRQAEPYLRRARDLDPLWPNSANYLGHTWVLMGRTDEGLAEVRRGFAIDTTNESSQAMLLTTLFDAGRVQEAGPLASKFVARTSVVRRLGSFAFVLFRAGRDEEGRQAIRRIEAAPDSTWARHTALAYVTLGARDTSTALTNMERAASGDGELLLALCQASTRFDILRSSKRYAAVLRRFNLDVETLTRPDGGRSLAGAVP